MRKMKLKNKLKTILLTLLLLGSSNALSDQALAKRLLQGQTATYDGTLFNDEAVRQIDIDLLEKDICENKLRECTPNDSFHFGVEEFLLGAIVGGFAIWAAGH